MDSSDDRIDLGRFGRSHALKGEVRLFVDERLSPMLTPGLLCHVPDPRGARIPMRITSCRSSEIRRGSTHGSDIRLSGENRLFFVKLDRVTTREQADALQGSVVQIDPTPEALQLLDVTRPADTLPIGYLLLDDGIPFGRIDRILENPAHPLLSVIPEASISEASGDQAESEPVLIPFTAPFINRVEDRTRTVHGSNLGMFMEI